MPVTHISHKKNGRAVLRYLLSKEGHNGCEQRNELISGINLIPNVLLLPQFDKYWIRARKNHTCQFQSIWISFSEKELSSDNAEDVVTAQKIGRQLVKTMFPDRQALIVCQADGLGKKLHLHLAISDVDIYKYKGCTSDQTDWHKISKLCDEITAQYTELDPIIAKKPGTSQKYTHTEEQKKKNDEYIWKDDIRDRVDQAMNESVSEADFIVRCKKHGVKAEKKYRKKTDKNYFTYTLTDYSNAPSDFKAAKGYREPKIRSYNLGSEYDYDAVMDQIEQNKASGKYSDVKSANDNTGSGTDIVSCCNDLITYAGSKTAVKKTNLSACYPASEYYRQLNQAISSTQLQINTLSLMISVLMILDNKKQAKIYKRQLYDLIDRLKKFKQERDQKVADEMKYTGKKKVRHNQRKYYDIDEIVDMADKIDSDLDEIKL